MIHLGKQSLDNTALESSVGLTVPAGTNYMTVEAVGGAMNYEVNGTPTTTATGDGSRLVSGQVAPFKAGFTTFRIIRQADSANQKVVVNYYGGYA